MAPRPKGALRASLFEGCGSLATGAKANGANGTSTNTNTKAATHGRVTRFENNEN